MKLIVIFLEIFYTLWQKGSENLANEKNNSKFSSKKRKRILLLGSFSILVICFTTYTTGKYWVQIYSKYKEGKQLSIKLKKLKREEAALKVDVNKMQDSDYIARYAREKYLYSKDGEFILSIK